MKSFKDISISAKLTILMAGLALASLVAGFAVITALDTRLLHQELVNKVTLLTRMYAEQCVPDLAFGYRDDAQEILEKLSLAEEIDYAVIYGGDGKIFASYTRAGAEAPPDDLAARAAGLHPGRVLEVSEPMSYKNVNYGTIWIKAATSELSRRIAFKKRVMGGLVVVIAFFSLIIAVLAQRLVSVPILKLAGLARTVAEAKDYSLRAGMDRADEIGALAVGFDAMLAGLEARIRERDAAEKTLKQSELKYRNLFNNAGISMFRSRLDGAELLDLNEAYLKLLGRTREETIGMPSVNVWADPGQRAAMAEIFKTRDRVENLEFRLLRKNGEIRDCITSLNIYRDEGILEGTIMDITERKQAAEALYQAHALLEVKVVERTAELKLANEELEAFTYSASHDLRAPIRRIDGFSALLEQECAGMGSGGQDYIARIRKGCRQMTSVVDDLLRLSRIMRQKINFGKVDLSALAGEAAGRLLETEPGRTVKFKAAQNLYAIGDAGLLSEVMDNLLSNAWKFTRKTENAEVEFGAEEQDGHTVYFVKDNGKGFDMKFSNKLFNPFQRLHSPDEFPGTGVGLSTVRRIVEHHGGNIWAEAAEDKGAAFYFTLTAPLDKKPVLPALPS